MPYILNKTNGVALTTVEDANLDLTTNLTFVGRNYSGYGEVFNENFLKLLENFANPTQPSKPVQGQLWYDTDAKLLKVSRDGKTFKSLANIFVDPYDPGSQEAGDLWWDSDNNQLKAFDGSTWKLIGPQTSAIARSSWAFVEEISATDLTETEIPVMKGKIGNDVVVTIAKPEVDITPKSISDLYTGFDLVKKGITLYGSDGVTGSSKNAGYYFWGTAAEALVANDAERSQLTSTSTNASFYVPFASEGTSTSKLYTSSGMQYNPSSGILSTTASSALYADLAERYESDSIYEVGTVVVIGGEKEVTTTTVRANTAVAGIVSTNPAYRMNAGAGTDETHPYIALKGRVPCKVIGPISKGNLVVTSEVAGHGCQWQEGDDPNAVIGKALGGISEGSGVIEVLVV